MALLAIQDLRKSYEATNVPRCFCGRATTTRRWAGWKRSTTGRQDKIALLGGSGMNRVVEAMIDGGSPIDAGIFSPPTIIIPAIGLTVLRYTTQAPVQGRSGLDGPLITEENAGDYNFAASLY